MKPTSTFLALIVLALPLNKSFAQGNRLPVVFAHGLGITALPYQAFVTLKKLFKSRGHELFIAETPIAGSLEERAAILNDEIHRLVPNGQFHLMGHSMGGLDARLVVYRYGLGDRVASVTTLASPHHGSPLADLVAGMHLPDVLERWFSGDLKAMSDLTPKNMDLKFNHEVKNDSRVSYFSVGFYIPTSVCTHSIVPWLWLTHQMLSDAGYPENDGMVSIESSRWGEFLGAFPGDHYSETSPIPLVGGPSYLEIFNLVLENIENRVENSVN